MAKQTKPKPTQAKPTKAKPATTKPAAAKPSKAQQRLVREKELQKLSIKELRNLAPYKENVKKGIKGDATSENPSKVEMIETILDTEIGKLHYPL